MRRTATVVLALLVISLTGMSAALAQDGPACSDILPIENHGEHVTEDYVFGDNSNASGGAALPGGPGPGFHFPNEVPPGASFCVDSNAGVIYTKNPTLSGSG